MKMTVVVVIALVAMIFGGIVSASKWAERFESAKDWVDRKTYNVGTALHLRKKHHYNPDKPTLKGIINQRRYKLGQSRKEAYKKTEDYFLRNKQHCLAITDDPQYCGSKQ